MPGARPLLSPGQHAQLAEQMISDPYSHPRLDSPLRRTEAAPTRTRHLHHATPHHVQRVATWASALPCLPAKPAPASRMVPRSLSACPHCSSQATCANSRVASTSRGDSDASQGLPPMAAAASSLREKASGTRETAANQASPPRRGTRACTQHAASIRLGSVLCICSCDSPVL